MQRTLAAVLSLTVCSCSLAFTSSPGDVGKPPQKIARCTERRGWPIADAVIGGVMLASSLSLLTQTSDAQSGGEDSSNTAAVITGVVLASAFGVSSYIGFSRTSRCRASHEEYLAAHPAPAVAPVAQIPVGANGGACTAQLTCDAGFVCSGMPDHTNQCIVAPQVTQAPPVTTAPVQTPPVKTAPVQTAPVQAPPAQKSPPVGTQGGACTPQLTCVLGLVCAGMPDHTNKCVVPPAR